MSSALYFATVPYIMFVSSGKTGRARVGEAYVVVLVLCPSRFHPPSSSILPSVLRVQKINAVFRSCRWASPGPEVWERCQRKQERKRLHTHWYMGTESISCYPSLLNLNTRQSAVERLVKADCGNDVEHETKAFICSTVVANLGEVQSTKVRASRGDKQAMSAEVRYLRWPARPALAMA